MQIMGIQLRGCRIGCLLGLAVLAGGVGCSEPDAPESTFDTTIGNVNALKPQVQSGEETEQSAGDAVDAVAEGVSAAWGNASSALRNFEGGKEILADMKQMYGTAKTSLSDVTSEKSAEKARAELNSLSQKLDEWKPKLSEMSEDTKVGVKLFFEHVADQLSTIGGQLSENEWVNDILRPKLREVIEQLKSLI
jgi:hypothetical protein